MKVIKFMFKKFTAKGFYMKKQELGFGCWVLGLAHLTFSIFVVLRDLAMGVYMQHSMQRHGLFKLCSGQTRVQYEGRSWWLYGMLFFTMVLLQCGILPTGVFAQERLAVTSQIANVRSGPGTNYDILWRVEKYYPLIVLDKKEGWVHFKDFEGDKAWIHNTLVKKINSVITLKDNCNVRSGPGTNTTIVFTVEKGVPFKVIETRGEWINVEHADGDRGWVFKRLLW